MRRGQAQARPVLNTRPGSDKSFASTQALAKCAGSRFSSWVSGSSQDPYQLPGDQGAPRLGGRRIQALQLAYWPLAFFLLDRAENWLESNSRFQDLNEQLGQAPRRATEALHCQFVELARGAPHPRHAMCRGMSEVEEALELTMGGCPNETVRLTAPVARAESRKAYLLRASTRRTSTSFDIRRRSRRHLFA